MESTFEKDEIVELIANALSPDNDLEREAVVQEIIDECLTPKEIADKYNEVMGKEESQVCSVYDTEKETFVFEDKK